MKCCSTVLRYRLAEKYFCLAETTNDVHETLSKARQMCETGLVNVSIVDQAGHKIDGNESMACITAKKTITEDLRAV